jgi:hypothetical protein
MRKTMGWVVCSLAVCAPFSGSAQENPIAPAVAQAPVAASSQQTLLKMGTLVDIEILDAVSSKTAKIGDTFRIRLSDPITIDGQVVVPAGVSGGGEVIHAAKARMAGKPGELIIVARYLDYQGTRLPLRGFKYGTSTGKNNVDAAAAVGFVVAAPLMLFISGGQVDVPPGTPANAKLSADTVIALTAKPAAVPAQISTQGENVK